MSMNHVRPRRCSVGAISVLFLLLLFPLCNILISVTLSLEPIFILDGTGAILEVLGKWRPDSNRVEVLGNFSIHVEWHPRTRAERFPTVHERVKLLMGNWYDPPCEDALTGRFKDSYHKTYAVDASTNESWPLLNISSNPWMPNKVASSSSTALSTMAIDSLVVHDVNIYLDRHILQDCARTPEQVNREGKLLTETRIRQRGNMQSYCSEVVDFLNTMELLDRQDDDDDTPTPVLAFFGDEEGLCEDQSSCFEIPLIAKHRAATTRHFIDQVARGECWQTPRTPLKTSYHQEDYHNKLSPILWKLELVRHWNTLPGALRKDTPWERKKSGAYWGGDMTGKYEGSTDLERCMSNQRCRFVLEHADSTLIDARLCFHHGGLTNHTVNGTKIIREKRGVEIVQQYKVVISFEGNDVASGLKWMLQSTSVVLMPPPTRTSWAMEELLEPWVHYIPMEPTGSNAEEMVQWVVDHDQEARRIAERATLFMYDLVYHPDASQDNALIKEEISRRYRALWH